MLGATLLRLDVTERCHRAPPCLTLSFFMPNSNLKILGAELDLILRAKGNQHAASSRRGFRCLIRLLTSEKTTHALGGRKKQYKSYQAIFTMLYIGLWLLPLKIELYYLSYNLIRRYTNRCRLLVDAIFNYNNRFRAIGWAKKIPTESFALWVFSGRKRWANIRLNRFKNVQFFAQTWAFSSSYPLIIPITSKEQMCAV